MLVLGNTPKYGLIYHSTFIGRAGSKNKGRISRYLANKCSIASRIDCFAETPSHIFGEKLRQQVEDRLKFYETGDLPKKNVEVMKEALEEYQQQLSVQSEKKKKKKKRKFEAVTAAADEAVANGDESSEPPKKKKKKNKLADSVELAEVNGTTEENEQLSKKKKKKKVTEGE